MLVSAGYLTFSLVSAGKPIFDVFFQKTHKTPREKAKKKCLFLSAFFHRTGFGPVPPVYKPFGSRKAHARNTPPPGSMGQGARVKGWLAGWLGWLGWLAGWLAGLSKGPGAACRFLPCPSAAARRAVGPQPTRLQIMVNTDTD